MKVAYFDCATGASGDMILGALLDAGLPLQELEEVVHSLGIPGVALRLNQVAKGNLRAARLEVLVERDAAERRFADIEELIRACPFPAEIKSRSLKIFQRLAQVEARIHQVAVEDVHLHELGGVDTIVDIVGTVAGLQALGIEQVYSSPLPMGRGWTDSRHGKIPLPAPATLALLEGVPIQGSDLQVELVTPTGAVLLTSLARSFGAIPPMTLLTTGYGAGGRDLPVPNVLRLLLGEQPAPRDGSLETLVLLETNLDNLNPELYDYLFTRLFAAEALDVFMTPIQMKKNRPGTLLSVLSRPGQADSLEEIVFTETSTLGIRRQYLERRSLKRTIQSVETPFGAVRVKFAAWEGGRVKFAPEYEDCRKLAEQHGVPLREIYLAAERAALDDPQNPSISDNGA